MAWYVKWPCIIALYAICCVIAAVMQHYGYDDALAGLALWMAIVASWEATFGVKK